MEEEEGQVSWQTPAFAILACSYTAMWYTHMHTYAHTHKMEKWHDLSKMHGIPRRINHTEVQVQAEAQVCMEIKEYEWAYRSSYEDRC